MKKALLSILLLTAGAGVMRGQDCSFAFQFTATGTLPGATGQGFDNRNRGCTTWTVTYTSTGFTAVSLVLQSAPSNGTVAGAWVTFAGTTTSGINPNTAITQAASTFTGYFPFIRINLASLTGAGTVMGLVYGWHVPAASIAATLGTVTAVGPDAPGTAPTQNPVQIAGVDQNTGFVQRYVVNANGEPYNILQSTPLDNVGITLGGRWVTNDPGAFTTGVIPSVLPYVFDGTSLDRLRGNAAGGVFSQGGVATGANFVTSTANPHVMAGQTLTGTLVQPVRVSTSGTVATIQGVGGIGPTDNQAGNAFSTGINGATADIQGPLWVSSSYSFNGTSYSLLRGAYLATFPTAVTTTARNAIGELLTEKSSRWTVVSNPAAGSQATASIAAEASVRHVADTICFAAASVAAPALTALTVNLRDGATGAGTVIATWQLAISAATGQNTAPFCTEGLNLVGTTNTAMTLEFSAALANLSQSVTVTGYNVN